MLSSSLFEKTRDTKVTSPNSNSGIITLIRILQKLQYALLSIQDGRYMSF
jgi:hypothetical protein